MKRIPCRIAIGVLAATALGGCASGPPPVAELATAKALVSEAQTSNATRYAPVELQHAKDKLSQADAAVQREEYPAAKAFAEEAEVDAQLSLTRTRAARARQAAAEVRQSNATLRAELERKSDGGSRP